MQRDRRAILSLVAMGRITPAEAERLLVVWNEGRELVWVLAASIVVAVLAPAGIHLRLSTCLHAAHSLFAGGWAQNAFGALMRLIGGTL